MSPEHDPAAGACDANVRNPAAGEANSGLGPAGDRP